MGAIVSHNALPESIWQPVHDVTVALLPVYRAARACLVYTWYNQQCCENGDLCCLYGCYNRSDKGKGKGISFFSFPNPRIKPEKKDLAASRLFNIGTGWTVKNYSFDKKVMNILRNLVLRLNYKKDLDLGSVNTWNLMQCLQYLVLNPHRAMVNKREKKGPRSAQKQL